MACVSRRWAPSRRMLVSTSWLLAAGRETFGLPLSGMVAYSGGKLAVKQTKFKPKYAAFFNSSHPQLSNISRQATEHEMHVADVDHGGTRLGSPFVVFAVPSTAAVPS